MRLVCTGALQASNAWCRNECPGYGGGSGECVRVYWCTMSDKSGNEWSGQEGGGE